MANKRDMFEGIKATLVENFGDEAQEYVEFLDKEIGLLDARAEKEKARRAAKKAEGDALKDAVKGVVERADGPITAAEIAEVLLPDFSEVTKAKVTYRATKLVNEGEIYKVQVKFEDGKKAVAYTINPPAEDEDAE